MDLPCIVCAFVMWVQVPGIKGDQHFQFHKAPITAQQCMSDAHMWGVRLIAQGFKQEDVHMDCIEWPDMRVPSEMPQRKHGR